MKLRFPHQRGGFERGFTMVEIALSLAIIGFALVAIIGVLPAGLSVQKENREQSVINLDAAFLMDAIRNGATGQSDLTNYINTVTISTTECDGTGRALGATLSTVYNSAQWGTASNLVGLLSTPKYVPVPPALRFSTQNGFFSNSVSVLMRAINSPAVDQAVGTNAENFAFQYQVSIEVIPSSNFPLKWNVPGPENLVSPAFVTTSDLGGPRSDMLLAQQLQNSVYDIRLAYKWPLLPSGANGQPVFGGGRQVFRSSIAGSMITNAGPGMTLYFMQPLTYSQPQ
jgi:type II secretory pathway pseudopilin PulG